MSGLSRLQLLVVDDNRNMRLLCRTLLRGFGIRNVFEAADPVEAFEVLRHAPIDIVVTDCLMQPIDGIEFTRLLRTSKDSPNPYVPIVMMTGHSERSRVAAARDAGVHTFLVKPIAARNLIEHVMAAIQDERSFVRTRTYFGPDRRIGRAKDTGEHRRRHTDSPDDLDLDSIPPVDGINTKKRSA
jgi:CheY-like chemotaxis protein